MEQPNMVAEDMAELTMAMEIMGTGVDTAQAMALATIQTRETMEEMAIMAEGITATAMVTIMAAVAMAPIMATMANMVSFLEQDSLCNAAKSINIVITVQNHKKSV